MNILKAFLLTLSLILFNYTIIYILELLIKEGYFLTDSSVYYIGIIGTLSYAFSYWLILFIIFKIKLSWLKGTKKTNALNINIIFYLLLISIGLHFFDQPFFDFSKIIDVFMDLERLPFQFYNEDVISLVFSGFAVLIISPIFEELFFRRLIFNKLYKKYTLNTSIIISSICFALIHLPNYRNLIPTFIFGIICCIIYVKTKRIIYPIILHFFGNLTWLLSIIYGEEYYKWLYELQFDFMYWSLSIFGVLLSILGLKKITTPSKVYK